MLGLHAKPVVVLDPDGHYTDLLGCLGGVVEAGFACPAALDTLVVATNVDDTLNTCAADRLWRQGRGYLLCARTRAGYTACQDRRVEDSALRFGTRTSAVDRALVMAIVNRTPDSFYDCGTTFSDPAALAAVDRAVSEGADIIDIGGVKAGPGPEIDAAEETRRVVPFVAAVRERYPDIVISVDTWRGKVGRLAVEEGADLLNDTWAGADPTLGEVAATTGVGIVCSHTGGALPRSMPHRARYVDVVADVIEKTTSRAETLATMGVPRQSILIDPTHDFGKNTWHGLELLRRAHELVGTGWPVLMALSNKDFVGETLGVDIDHRIEGTLAATAVAAFQGVAVFRAHNVKETRRTLEMVASILGTRLPTACLRGLS